MERKSSTWFAGVYVDEGPDRDKLTRALAKENYIPVYLDQRTVDLHYNGFCNSVLWQLFHYVPLNMDSKLSETRCLPSTPCTTLSVCRMLLCTRVHLLEGYGQGQHAPYRKMLLCWVLTTTYSILLFEVFVGKLNTQRDLKSHPPFTGLENMASNTPAGVSMCISCKSQNSLQDSAVPVGCPSGRKSGIC